MAEPTNPRPNPSDDDDEQPKAIVTEHGTLKYSLLGPSLTKAGQDAVDQSKVSEVIYNASKGSKFFNREEARDQILTQKIAQILAKKRRLERLDLTRETRQADQLLAQLDAGRDLTQYLVHVDCDAFYAAVELLDRPELAHRPFAVGGGVLTTCNYVARTFGCRSGMAGFVAKKLCPELLLLPLNFAKYTAKAREVRAVLARYDPRFESASIDEAYLNITEYCVTHNLTPDDAVQQMRDEVHAAAKITVSAGIAPNAKLAKICSNLNKPNGQYRLPNERAAVMAFMRDLPTRKVNGVGRVLERELLEIGVRTCGDIYEQRRFLRQLFGDKTFEFLIMCHLGLGRTNVQPAEDYERKSVGTESTFRDLADPAQLREKLRWISDELEKDMRRAECKGRTLVLKAKLHTYEVLTRQVVTPKAIHLADDLYNYALPILTKLMQEVPGMKLRLMGLRCTNLVSTKKPDTAAFFGLNRPLRITRSESADSPEPGNDTRKRKASSSLLEGEWEEWPEEALYGNDAELEGQVDAAQSSGHGGGGVLDDEGKETYRHHGKEVTPNPRNAASPAAAEETWWDCPICMRPQAADERQFNEHIDLCLSRQTIRDAVQRDSASNSPSATSQFESLPDSKRQKTGGGTEKKRGRPAATAADPRQKKLFFG
ncbi:ImpB/mucB/samB family protein [Apiospora phragmitis]|uniref:DNA polymerase kappa n=1 Tax=Apiospora phragmitis TaxID=2905665 RepID=A0ABR1USC6_9PEZI